MKTIKYIFSVLVLVIAFASTSCEKLDNINPKAATEVPVNTLFSNAQVALVNQVNNMSVNYNTTRLLVQYWQETTYFSEARYDFSSRNIPDNYSTALYRDVIMDLKEAKTILEANVFTGPLAIQRDNQVAIADILQVYAFQVAVDAFGDMPYSEALLGIADATPAYDDAATIYTDLLARLTADIAKLSVDASQGSYGSADFIYGGDVALWKKFAASLKLRIGMRLADFNATAAKAAVESAYLAGVFASQSESGILYYPGVYPHVNTIYIGFSVDGRLDYIPTNTLVNLMKSLGDPRLPLYFTQIGGDYLGAVAGADAAATYSAYSHFADRFFQPEFEAILIDYVEVQFLLAEAAQRTWSVGGTAENYFNNGVKESILYWEGTDADASAYLAANPYNAANWKQSIGTQKWLALYNRGVEAWAEWRRLDYPVLNTPTGMVYTDIPKRMPYPFNEIKNNKDNYVAASAAIGGDDWRTKLFWDIF
jgi:hypothetical protein